jgi:PAS domain S-box-containing protein
MTPLERLDQLEFVHRTAGVTSWVWDVREDRVQWFGEPEALLGLAPGSYSGRFPDYLSLLHPDDVPQARQTYVDCLTGARPSYRSEERLVRRDGSVRWLECFGRAEYGAGGRAVRMAGVVRDVTERRSTEQEIRTLNEKLEERVRIRTAELEAANRELDCFSLSVSHDLLAPVRNITAFARVLLQDCRNALGADLLQMLQRIERNAQRMDQMVHGLLDLSRAGRAALDIGQLQLGAMAGEMLEDLRTAWRYEGTVKIDAPHPGRGDLRMVRQVLQNLIGNAMKFSRSARSPEIALTSAPLQDGRVEYCVRDNGCGFDMSYAGRLFGTFQRLHSAVQFEGTGIGLSTVKRIVERHGGAVRAAGEIGRGAAFFFTLPGI